MEVILFENVAKLGRVGDVVKVKDGFARNYLFPKKIAYAATPTNLKRIEAEKIRQRKIYDETKASAEAQAEELVKVSCTIDVEVNEQDKLYGSVKSEDIAKALETEGFNIDKKSIILKDPIEELGVFEVKIQLHDEVATDIRVWVTKK